jgi:hypothetical protein
MYSRKKTVIPKDNRSPGALKRKTTILQPNHLLSIQSPQAVTSRESQNAQTVGSPNTGNNPNAYLKPITSQPPFDLKPSTTTVYSKKLQ